MKTNFKVIVKWTIYVLIVISILFLIGVPIAAAFMSADSFIVGHLNNYTTFFSIVLGLSSVGLSVFSIYQTKENTVKSEEFLQQISEKQNGICSSQDEIKKNQEEIKDGQKAISRQLESIGTTIEKSTVDSNKMRKRKWEKDTIKE